MADGYIGKVQIDNGAILPVGSTLFGVCNTPAYTGSKIVQTSDATLGNFFDELIKGVTIHIQFTYGNTIGLGDPEKPLTLKIGDTAACPIANPGGSCMWSENAVVSFTFDNNNWVCNDSTIMSVPIKNNYNANDTDAISGIGVADALSTITSNTTSVIKNVAFTEGSLPSLTIENKNIPNVTNIGETPTLEVQETTVQSVTTTGRSTTMTIENGVLNITTAIIPTFNDVTIKEVKTWNAGSAPTLGNDISVGSASAWSQGELPSLYPVSTTVLTTE